MFGVVWVAWQNDAAQRAQASLRRFVAPPTLNLPDPARLSVAPLTPELRAKGYHECYPIDPIGLGPYKPYVNVSFGRMAIPQKGGHTADWGFDVVVHFHGHEPIRKVLVQVARGVVYVGVDRGLGSGPYANDFAAPLSFARFRHAIERGLQRATGQDEAHIRHLALSAWSAGYGAVNEILKHGDDGIDAVILLDGLHARFDPSVRREKHVRAVNADFIEPTFEFAEKALSSEKIFVFTHSEVDPVTYPSTELTADLLLERVGLERSLVQSSERFGMTGKAEKGKFYLWSYTGKDEKGHCAHVAHIAPVLQNILEPEWDTPPMDRDVPHTPAPKMGSPDAANQAANSDPAQAKVASGKAESDTRRVNRSATNRLSGKLLDVPARKKQAGPKLNPAD